MDTLTHKRRLKAQPSLGPYNEGGYKWAVYFTGEDGKRTRRKFYQKNDAESFLADKLVEVENLGTKVAAALDDEVKRHAFTAVEALKPFGKSIVDAVNFYRAHLEATAKSALVSDLTAQFQTAKELEGKSDRYLSDLETRLRPFVEKFGTRYASEVTPKDLQEWLTALEVSNVTRNNYRRVLGAFFAWCWRMGYCPENPVLKVTRSKQKQGVITIYTPAEMRALLRSAATWQPDRIKREGPQGRNCCEFVHETKDVLANMALCGFAGLRQSEFERLTWEQVKLDRGLIDLSASITKTAARRLVKIKPVLAAWLRHLSEPILDCLRREIKKFADLKPDNDLLAEILENDVIKREAIEGEKAEGAAKRVSRYVAKSRREKSVSAPIVAALASAINPPAPELKVTPPSAPVVPSPG